MFRFLVAGIVVCSVSLLALQIFVSIQPAEVHAQPASGCADGTTEQFLGTLPNGAEVHGCNGAVPFVNADALCAASAHVGDVVTDSGLKGVLEGTPGSAIRWIHINGDPGSGLGLEANPANRACWGTLSPCASPNPSNIRPVHSINYSLYYNGTEVLAGTGQAVDGVGNFGSVCVTPPPALPCDGVWNTPGQHDCTVPSGVTELVADIRGAQGDHGYGDRKGEGGTGGRVQTILQVTPGQTLHLFVGGKGFIDDQSSGGTTRRIPLGGFNGGGNGSKLACTFQLGFLPHGGGGGGASDIRVGGTALADRVVVAGGGAGGGGSTNKNDITPAGDGGAGGGGDPNGDGEDGLSGGQGGKGATTSSFGVGGSGDATSQNGFNGTSGQGGQGGQGDSNPFAQCGGGGGGGGGYYGGGGGGGSGNGGGSGGGGGSSFCSGACGNPQFRPAFQAEDGYIELRPFTGGGAASVSITGPVASSWHNSDFQVQYTAVGTACEFAVRNGSTASFGSATPISCSANSATVQVPGACSAEGQAECGARVTASNAPAQIPTQALYKSTPGSATWIVPAGVSEVEVELWGAEGSQGPDASASRSVYSSTSPGGVGGLGGYVKTKLQNLNAGDTIGITIGAAGVWSSGEGGEASVFRVNGTPAVVAGGGGGGGDAVAGLDCDEGHTPKSAHGGAGGAGGGLVGGRGQDGLWRAGSAGGHPNKEGGRGGDTPGSAPGVGGPPNGQDGIGSTGGPGPGGHGGNGQFGGGGGASGRFHCGRFGGGFISSDYLSGGGGGGGGSSYVDSAFEVSGSTTHTQGCATCRGAGAVAISYVGLPLPGSTAQDEEFFNIDLTAPTVTNFTASDGTTTVNASNDPLVAMSSPVTLEWGAADAPGGAGLGAQELWQAAYIAGLCDENDISRCSWVQRFTNATSPATDTPPLGKWWYSVRAYDQSLPSGNCITDQGAHCGGTPGPDRLDPRTAIGPILIEMPTIGGLVPCGRQTDSIDTPWNETENCEFRHFFLLARILVDFTLWRAVPLIIAVLLLATGAIFYFSFGGPGAMARVRQIWRAVLLGSLILIFSWLFLNFLLGIIGFDINVFGRWYDVQL